jgi:hypothetical protein
LTVSTNPDIIFGTEIWIDSNIKGSQIFPSGYNIFRKNRNCGGGGVLIAVKDIFIVTSVLLICWVFAFNNFVSQPGRLKSPAVMMNALVMVSALFMLLSNSKYPFSFDVFGL